MLIDICKYKYIDSTTFLTYCDVTFKNPSQTHVQDL